MSTQKVRLDIHKINSREAIDRLEQHLKQLDGVEIHQLGLNEVRLTYDRTTTSPEDLEQAVQQAGGTVQRIHPED